MSEDFILIPLNRDQFTKVSPEDYEWLNRWKWYAERSSSSYENFYATRGSSKHKDGYMKMHRLILGLSSGDVRCVDHINHDTLDNRRCNLRICTRSENNRNSRVRSDNKSGLKGAYFHKHSGRWRSHIKVGDKVVYLGMFGSAEEAHSAYAQAAKKYHGDFSHF